MAKRKSQRRRFSASGILTVIRKAVLLFIAVTVCWVLLYRFVNPPVTWLMLQRGLERKFDGKDWKLEKQWRDFDELSANLKLAAVAGEDARFLQHWGFDMNAIQKAYQKNEKGLPLRGGSTISQQTAKNVFLWPGRSWIRKGFEAYFTALIELLWSKKRILEVYLNVIETGDGIYGAEAATQAYFHKPAIRLSRSEAALLVAVFPNPRRWSPAKPTAYIYHKQQLILRNMRRIRKLEF
ncbi:monofunctional biosynthetic peptidoglycan transglycosylase [Pedobacter sp. BS3]|uniref:monofunctional biosynthetic peptidoglycan transglycosylase n=1 Tax=Pedobacter sp. BS3 TaxID=2567937 RepID=UPI0011EC7D89|nr:monofunctional biosynthetic peptidoglycan transglycosylase [Pedobacter sp. BS3]TZF82190.1 monofunctional biosynthetic peptidoglycan transglycosylase [Pedobacter sp. BS3]